MEFIWGWNNFLKILNKLMQRERDFEEFKYFLSPSQRSFCTVTDQQTDTPPTHPRQSKKAQCLENENEAKSRCQGGRQKVRHWRTPEFIKSHFSVLKLKNVSTLNYVALFKDTFMTQISYQAQ